MYLIHKFMVDFRILFCIKENIKLLTHEYPKMTCNLD